MKKVLLVGNPNTGKTTLFNTMARASEHVGNWHGVTVAVKEKKFKYKEQEYLLCDLPGIYSLDYISKEEKISSEYIKNNDDAIILCMLDANNLKRNLYLALDLLNENKNIIIAINMAKEQKNLNAEKLEKILGVPVLKIDARSKKSVKNLLEILDSFSIQKSAKKTGKNQTKTLKEIEEKTIAKFNEIDQILRDVEYNKKDYYGYSKLDKILLNPIASFIIFLAVMGLVFFITFGSIGEWFSGVVSGAFEFVFDKAIIGLKPIINSEIALNFIKFAVFDGALTVISFMPQIVLMMVCLNFLEDVGYLSRVAFMFDGFFKKMGLTGRSAFSLIMGFGCTTSALQTTRNLETQNAREKTAFMLPFMSCSAKLPIYAVICSAFFSKYKALMVFLLYVIGIILMVLISLIFSSFLKEKNKDSFILEMPKLRIPNIKKVIKNALESAKSFFIRVGGVLLISSIVIYLLNNFSFSLKYVGQNTGESMLEIFAGIIDFLFVPLGFGSKGAVVAILSGIIAKEMVVSSLAIVNGVSAGALAESLVLNSSAVHFSTLSAVSFLIFILLYSPCISAVVSMKKEIGGKNAFKSFVFQFIVAYVASAAVYLIGGLIIKNWILGLCVVILLALLITLMLKLLKRKKYNLHGKVDVVACGHCTGGCCGNNKLRW